MLDHRVFVVQCLFFAILLNRSYGGEEQAECKNMKKFRVPATCCNVPVEELLTEEDKAVGPTCEKAVYGDRTAPPTGEERLELSECMEECLYNGTHMLTDEMKLNETALIAQYDVTIKNFPKWKGPINKAVKKCIEKNVISKVKPEAKCKSGAYQFTKCFVVNLYLNCPEENWNADDERCTKVKEMLEKCFR